MAIRQRAGLLSISGAAVAEIRQFAKVKGGGKPGPKSQAERSKDYRARLKQRREAFAQQAETFAKVTPVAPQSANVSPRDADVALLVSRPIALQNSTKASRSVTWRHVTLRARACVQPSVIVCFLLFTAFASVGLYQSGNYAWSFGLTVNNKSAFAVLTVAAECVALFGLTVVASLWRHRSYALATAVTAGWCGAIVFAAFNSVGFTATNIDDTLAGREQARNLQTAITVELETKRKKRNTLESFRYTTPESVVSAAKSIALQCPENKITGKCKQLFTDLRELERNRDLTQEAAALTADIRKLEADMRITAPIGSADPLVNGLRRLTHDQISDEAITNIRMGFLAVVTLIGGLFLACCRSLVDGAIAAAVGRARE